MARVENQYQGGQLFIREALQKELHLLKEDLVLAREESLLAGPLEAQIKSLEAGLESSGGPDARLEYLIQLTKPYIEMVSKLGLLVREVYAQLTEKELKLATVMSEADFSMDSRLSGIFDAELKYYREVFLTKEMFWGAIQPVYRVISTKGLTPAAVDLWIKKEVPDGQRVYPI